MLRTRTVCVLLMLATSAAVGGGAIYHHHRYKHLAVHDEGMVYRSAWLSPGALQEVVEEHQIRSVVNLCEPWEMDPQQWADERRVVAEAGARLIELPMPTSIDPADSAIARHIAVLGDPDNYPMLVHCQHGVTRTAKLLAIYDIAFRGLSAEESLAAQPLFGRDHHNVHVRAFVNRFERRHDELYPTAASQRLNDLRMLGN